jgi:hypothetical protein
MIQGHLFTNDIHHTLRDDDNLCDLLAFGVTSGALISTYGLFDGVIVGVHELQQALRLCKVKKEIKLEG